MENAIKWIFSLAAAVLLLYACVLFRTTCQRLNDAGTELSELKETEQKLREENNKLSQRLAAADGIFD